MSQQASTFGKQVAAAREWFEGSRFDLVDAREFAEAIHAEFPDQMLAYNLSPSFNWDTTGMSDDEMKQFPAELGKLGYVFNSTTYGGHQIDGLAEWLEMWRAHYDLSGPLQVELKPHTAGSELLELKVVRGAGESVANIVFANIHDRRGESFLSVRDQNTFDETLRKKRLFTLIHLFLIHRYKASSVHYVSPTDDVLYQTERMKHHGIFANVHSEIGQMIVASVNAERIAELLEPDRAALKKLVDKTGPPSQ